MNKNKEQYAEQYIEKLKSKLRNNLINQQNDLAELLSKLSKDKTSIEVQDAMEAAERNNQATDTEYNLACAEQHIEKLRCELKEREAEIVRHVERWQYYEKIIKKILTFD